MLIFPPLPNPMPASPKALRLGQATVGFNLGRAAKHAAREINATVVVEDEFLILPSLPANPHWGFMQWRSGTSAMPSGVIALGALPMPAWMDPSVVRSGGNVVSRVHSIGGVGF